MRIPIVDKFPAKAIVFQKRGNGLTAFIDNARFMEKNGLRFYELKKHTAKFRPSSFDDFIPGPKGKPLILLYEYQRDMLVPINTAHLGMVYERDADGTVIDDWSKFVCNAGHHFAVPYDFKTSTFLHGVKDNGCCPHCGTESFKELPEGEWKSIPRIKEMLNLHAIDEDMAFWGQMRRWNAEQRHKPESFLVKYKEFIMIAVVFVFCIMIAYIFMTNISDSAKGIINAIGSLKGVVPIPG